MKRFNLVQFIGLQLRFGLLRLELVVKVNPPISAELVKCPQAASDEGNEPHNLDDKIPVCSLCLVQESSVVIELVAPVSPPRFCHLLLLVREETIRQDGFSVNPRISPRKRPARPLFVDSSLGVGITTSMLTYEGRSVTNCDRRPLTPRNHMPVQLLLEWWLACRNTS